MASRCWPARRRQWSRPEVKAKLLANTQSAFERGAFGAPTFFVGSEMFFGKDRLRDFEEQITGGQPKA